MEMQIENEGAEEGSVPGEKGEGGVGECGRAIGTDRMTQNDTWAQAKRRFSDVRNCSRHRTRRAAAHRQCRRC